MSNLENWEQKYSTVLIIETMQINDPKKSLPELENAKLKKQRTRGGTP